MASDSESWVFWAKTPDRFTRDDVDSDGLDVWLSLRQHLRDTADVGELLASSWVAPSLQKRLIQLAGDEESAVALVAWLAGTHDIGKAELHFSQQLLRRPDVEHLQPESGCKRSAWKVLF
ncbi:HD domain-containing protein [Flaviflexus equikiangi]|uniref:HD domain-containing protein n=1 Tax=Flaviflexus equikiangi TaxID=2758573 RepID=UPI0015F71C30|nr:HD domain-containing protein [Flaviflexus equikiangi]